MLNIILDEFPYVQRLSLIDCEALAPPYMMYWQAPHDTQLQKVVWKFKVLNLSLGPEPRPYSVLYKWLQVLSLAHKQGFAMSVIMDNIKCNQNLGNNTWSTCPTSNKQHGNRYFQSARSCSIYSRRR